MKNCQFTKTHFFSICFLIFIWWLLSLLINRSFILPTPLETMQYLLNSLFSKKFYISISISFLRISFGFILSMISALVLSIMSNEYKIIREIFKPLAILTKTIPNISYMIFALIWFGSEGAIALVTFMILFPVFFNNFTNYFDSKEPIIKDVEILYPETFMHKFKSQIIPNLLPELLHTAKTAASLAFKVGIMAEILGASNLGIGREISYCKAQLNMAGIFAWTIVIILICLLLDLSFDQMLNYRLKEESGWKN